MNTKTPIDRMGNARGIPVPQVLPELAELPEDVELHAEPGQLVIRAAPHARAGWADAARVARAGGDNRFLDASTPTQFDRTEWEW